MSGGAFSKRIDRFIKMVDKDGDRAVRKVVLGLLANVTVASPVDTGRFRGNWQLGVGQRPAGTLQVEEKDASAVVARESTKAENARAGTTAYISNNLPYAMALEYGHSKQAPHGMVRLAFRSLKQILGVAVKKKG